MEKKILIIGASGFLGKQIFSDFSKKFAVKGTYNSNPAEGMAKLDLNDFDALKKICADFLPDIIIHCAGETKVDSYETDSTVPKIQLKFIKNISDACNLFRATLVFFSTDFVFDGKKGNYNELDKTRPKTAYGKNKLECEKIAQKVKNHLILRVSTLYGADINSKKFVNYTISKLLAGEEILVASDYFRSPTLINDISAALSKLISVGESGIFHVAGDSQISLFAAAKLIAKEFRQNAELVKPCKGKELGFQANRPLDTTLNILKLQKKKIFTKSFEEGLKFVKKQNKAFFSKNAYNP